MSLKAPLSTQTFNTSVNAQLTSLVQSKILASPRKGDLYPSPPNLSHAAKMSTITPLIPTTGLSPFAKKLQVP